MKYCLGLLLLLFNVLAFSQKIKKVEVFADPSDNLGKCPVTFHFKALITYSGSGKILYTWIRSDGSKMKPIEKILPGKSGQTETVDSVLTNWAFSKNLKRKFNGFQSLKIFSPDSLISNKAYFSVQCQDSDLNHKILDSSKRKIINRTIRNHNPGPFPYSNFIVNPINTGTNPSMKFQISFHNEPAPEFFLPTLFFPYTNKTELNINSNAPNLGKLTQKVVIHAESNSFLVSDFPLEANSIYPGAIFDAIPFSNGLFKDYLVKRNPIKISISNLYRTNNSNPSILVENPNLDNVNKGISKLFQGITNLNQSDQYSLSVYEHLNYFDYTLMASGGLSFCSFCLPSSSNTISNGTSTTISLPGDSTVRHLIIDARKILFTINAESDSSGFYIKNKEDEKDKQPLVVRSVQYGARILIAVDIKNGLSDYILNIPYGAFNNNADQLIKYLKVKGDSLVNLNAKIFGGDGSFSPTPNLNTLNETLTTFFNKLNYQNAIPIGFQLGDLNNQLVTERNDLIPNLNFIQEYPFQLKTRRDSISPGLKYVFAKVTANNLNPYINLLHENYDFALINPTDPLDSTPISEMINASDGTEMVNPNTNFNIYWSPQLNSFIKSGGGYFRIFGHRNHTGIIPNTFNYPTNINISSVALTLVFNNGKIQKLNWSPGYSFKLSNNQPSAILKLYFSSDKNGNLTAINP